MKVWVVSGYDLDYKSLIKPAVFMNKEEAENWCQLRNEEAFLIVYDLDEVEIKESLE